MLQSLRSFAGLPISAGVLLFPLLAAGCGEGSSPVGPEPDGVADPGSPEFIIFRGGLDDAGNSGSVPNTQWHPTGWGFLPDFGVREFFDPQLTDFPGPCVTDGKCSVGTVFISDFGGYGLPNNPKAVPAPDGDPSTSFALMSTSNFDFDWDPDTEGAEEIHTLQSAIRTSSFVELPATGLWELSLDFAFLTNSGGTNDFFTVVIEEDFPPFDGMGDQTTEVLRVERNQIGSSYAGIACATSPIAMPGTGTESATYDRCTDDGDPTDGDKWINEAIDLTSFLGSKIRIQVLVSEGDFELETGESPADLEDGFPATLLLDNVQVLQNLAPTGPEGSPISIDLVLEPGATSPTFAWDFTEMPLGCGVAGETTQTPDVTCPDDASFDVSVEVTFTNQSSFTETAQAAGTVVVQNAPPVIASFTGFPTDPIQVGFTVSGVTGTFTDPGAGDTHTATIDWGDGTTESVTVDPSTGTVGPASHTYNTAGVFAAVLTVTDDDGGTDQATFEFVTVFDPSAGFVTGGGWFDSPPGAYPADPTLTGKATFGFVSRHRPGKSVPDGNTQFGFKAGGLNFHSTAYEWLVIAGPQAKFKGTGTINGAGDYGFMVSATDGALTGGDDEDRIRIKVWDRDAGDAVVYDNEMGASDDADPTTALGGGSIVIQKK